LAILYKLQSVSLPKLEHGFMFIIANVYIAPVPVAAGLLRMWVRIPPVARMSVVIVVCCQVEVFATSWSHIQRSPTDCGASLCVI